MRRNANALLLTGRSGDDDEPSTSSLALIDSLRDFARCAVAAAPAPTPDQIERIRAVLREVRP